nr:unnamed protein product [Callosobruchus analis]
MENACILWFCEGTSPTPDLVRIIKILIRRVRETGLKFVATISDKGATNQAAINNLLQATSAQWKKIIIPSFKNWVFSLDSLIYLTKHLLEVGYKYVCLKNFNQDPVENYFSCIRCHGVRNVNPTCFAFVNANKSLLLNNLVSKHSLGSNCEQDESEGVLTNLREFVTTECSPFELPQVPQTIQPLVVQEVYLEPNITAYVAGYGLKIIMKNRTHKQLKNKYEAIKKEIKKQHSQYMAYQRGTGGGPYMKPPSPKTDDERVLASIIAFSVKELTST